MYIMITIGLVGFVVSLCCLCYFVGRHDAEKRVTQYRDPRIDAGEIVEITVKAKDYVQFKRITPKDLENPGRMADIGRCMSLFYRTADKL